MESPPQHRCSVVASPRLRAGFTSLPSMNAVGPLKGCSWTGLAPSTISSPMMLHPKNPVESNQFLGSFRHELYLCIAHVACSQKCEG